MTEFQNFKLSPASFLTIATNVLYKTLLEASRTSSKTIFKAVSEGRKLALLDVRIDEDTNLRFDLTLDHSEFRGGRLNFAAFRNSLTVLVGTLSESLKKEAEVSVFTEETDGSMLFGVPGVTRDEEHMNVLMLGANLRSPGAVLLKLQYLDPEQFEDQQKQTG
jgi:hypothetical protein